MTVNLSQISSEKKRINNFINSRLQSHFDINEVDLSKRVRLEGDLEKWRPDVEEIWEQKEEKVGHVYSIYFDDEFICSFSISDKPGVVEYKFLKGITDLYERNIIFFDKDEYLIRDELAKMKEREEQKKIDLKTKSKNPEVNKIIKELNEPENA